MGVEVAILSLSMFSLCQSVSFLREIKTQMHQVRPYHMLVRKSRRDLRQLVPWQLRGEWAGKTMCKCPGVPSSRDESVCAAGRQWQPAHWFHTGNSINRATQTRAGERYPVSQSWMWCCGQDETVSLSNTDIPGLQDVPKHLFVIIQITYT